MLARTLRQKSITFTSAATRGSVVRTGTKRFNSTKPNLSGSGPKSQVVSSMAAGVAGGLVTLAGGQSPIPVTHGTISPAPRKWCKPPALHSTRLKPQRPSTPNRNEIVSFLRFTFGLYLSFIPGATAIFDELDSLAESHGDELNNVLLEAYNDLKATLEKGGFDAPTVKKVGEIAKRLGDQLKELGKDMGQKAKKVVDEAYKEVGELFQQGVSPQGIYKATQLVQEKTQQVKDLGRNAAEKAWEKGTQEAQQYLDKVPQVKKVVEENMSSIKAMALGGGLSTSMIPQVFQKVKEAATSQGDSRENAEKLKKYFEDLAQQGKSKMGGFQNSDTWQMVEKYIKSIPGGEEALKDTPSLNELISLSKKGPEAEKLAKETVQEISEVLKKRIQQAKDLAGSKK
ncbi:hypothetical protein BDD12DRAFT_880270 [Trichophaea hybrida]|nr:hypothetical protein BDD12DRAFT_880270 [Trichophaea hybrida]